MRTKVELVVFVLASALTFGSHLCGAKTIFESSARSCTTEAPCSNDFLFCLSESEDSQCDITCENSNTCKNTTFIIANTGGMSINCMDFASCKNAKIEWVNSDNLQKYKSVNSDVSIGGALHSLDCAGIGSCFGIHIKGQTQETALDSNSLWNCEGEESCMEASISFKGTLSLECQNTGACDNLNATCLSGAKCVAEVLDLGHNEIDKDKVAVGAMMYCMPGVEMCECPTKPYFNCTTVTIHNTTAQPFEFTSTLKPTDNHGDGGGDDSLDGDSTLIVVVFIIIVGVLIGAVSYWMWVGLLKPRRKQRGYHGTESDQVPEMSEEEVAQDEEETGDEEEEEEEDEVVSSDTEESDQVVSSEEEDPTAA